jgi:hypothetical protein
MRIIINIETGFAELENLDSKLPVQPRQNRRKETAEIK